jgi:hypothetical protein
MARKVGSLLTLVVLAVSGLYLLVYLYRWEWNRALVAGLFFVAAEIAAVATTVLRRLRSIEDRLAAGPSREQVLLRLQESAPSAANRFAWLDERMRSTNVFVPVLLGAGVILSLLATGVERLAAAGARPQLERRLAGRLELLALPAGGLLGPEPPLVDATPRSVRAVRNAFLATVALVGVLGVVQVIDIVADATQSRPEKTPIGGTELTISVNVKGARAVEAETAEALWVTCRYTINRGRTASELEHIGSHTYRFVLSPAIGEHAQRRLEGCIEDATLARTSAHVVAIVPVLQNP